MRKAKWTITLALALVLAMGTAAFAAQTPLLPANIPMFAQPLPQLGPTGIPFTLGTTVADPANPTQQNVNVSLCEFQTTILPAGTVLAPGATGLTSVWGYLEGTTCPDKMTNVNHSYLGPVVLATRGIPTQMTFTNLLPDAVSSNVQAYKDSTDQTVIWGDPLSLISASAGALPITQLDGNAVWNPIIDPGGNYLSPVPEANECYLAARDFHLQLIPAMPDNCLDNYGFIGRPPGATNPASTYIAPIPAAVHIHGGEVPAVLDGGPDAWWTPNGIYGHGYYSRGGVLDAQSGKAIYVYPNAQEAAPIWFHDHILGATRLNVYAGIAGGYMVTDSPLSSPNTLPPGLLPLGLDRTQGGVAMNGTLDLGTDEVLIPLIIQDRMFDTTGQLYFPAAGINPEHPYWVPEFVGDTIAVNGAVWPFLNVEPKRYRFLVLNGSNARAYELAFEELVVKINTKTKQKKAKTVPIWVIGNDQGYLDAPAQIAYPNRLVIMPGERYEIIVDFAAAAGTSLLLTNTAAVPYPGPGLSMVLPPNEGQIMQFVVAPTCVDAAQCGAGDTTYDPASGIGLRYKLDPLSGLKVADPIVRLADPLTGNVAAGVTVSKYRRLTLNEVLTLAGPLEILVNNTLYDGDNTDRLAKGLDDFTAQTTLWNTSHYSELPHEGETELWEIVNLTVDAHPMHPHLVAFQVLNRQAFEPTYPATYDASFPGGGLDPLTNQPYPAGVFIPGFGPPLDYNCTFGAPARGVIPPTGVGGCVYGGNPAPTFIDPLTKKPYPIMPPAAQETGWKDTVTTPPGMVTRVLVRFARATDPANANPDLIGYDFDPGAGHGYVWHCHIIDHEDNEMMRPYQVVTNPGVTTRTFIQGFNY